MTSYTSPSSCGEMFEHTLPMGIVVVKVGTAEFCPCSQSCPGERGFLCRSQGQRGAGRAISGLPRGDGLLSAGDADQSSAGCGREQAEPSACRGGAQRAAGRLPCRCSASPIPSAGPACNPRWVCVQLCKPPLSPVKASAFVAAQTDCSGRCTKPDSACRCRKCMG